MSKPRRVKPEDEVRIGIDIGGTLAKVVIYLPNKASKNSVKFANYVLSRERYGLSGVREQELEIKLKHGTIHVIKFLSARMKFLDQIGLQDLNLHAPIYATGGGAHKYASILESLTHVKLQKFDEMQSLVKGLQNMIRRKDGCFTLANARFGGDVGTAREKLLTLPIRLPPKKGFIVVNIGSGVSMLQIGGSSLGGSTFLGLCALLTGCDDFDQAIDLAANGDSTKVDMLVKDIYGDKMKGELFGTLRPTTLAASFGKMLQEENRKKVKKEDLALATLVMCSMNVAAMAHIHAKHMNINYIVFTGNFLATTKGLRSQAGYENTDSFHLHGYDTLSLHKRNTVSMRILSYAVSFWSKKTKRAVFMKHEGCLGALGALGLGQDQENSPSPSRL